MGAAAGGLVGGPVGALIGGGIGALNSAFAELADRARESADALADQAARVKSGRRFDIDMKDFEQQRQDKEMLKKQTAGTAAEKSEAMTYFRTQLDDTKKKYENVRANMEKSGIAAAPSHAFLHRDNRSDRFRSVPEDPPAVSVLTE